jgi:hypothetical protein
MTISDDPSFIIKTKSTGTEPTDDEVKEEGLISCDAVINSSILSSLEFINRICAFH